MGYPPLRDTFRCITHPFAARRQGCPRAAARLACVKHSASVQSEPGSNSSVQSLFLTQRIFRNPTCVEFLLFRVSALLLLSLVAAEPYAIPKITSAIYPQSSSSFLEPDCQQTMANPSISDPPLHYHSSPAKHLHLSAVQVFKELPRKQTHSQGPAMKQRGKIIGALLKNVNTLVIHSE